MSRYNLKKDKDFFLGGEDLSLTVLWGSVEPYNNLDLPKGEIYCSIGYKNFHKTEYQLIRLNDYEITALDMYSLEYWTYETSATSEEALRERFNQIHGSNNVLVEIKLLRTDVIAKTN